MSQLQLATTPQRAQHWELRAQQYAHRDQGLPAVCAYGMPRFYNRAIELCQQRALAPWLQASPRPAAGAQPPRALDVGCGVARWSLRLARAGYRVTGIDLSPTMVQIASGKAAAAGVDCHFEVADLAELTVSGQFDLILSVTVLQHVLEAEIAREAIRRLAARLAPGGRLVLLEAAPQAPTERCDNLAFRARTLEWYHEALLDAGLNLVATRGVDPTPFKTWLLPRYPRLPRALGLAALATSTAIALPLDLALARVATRSSWHKVMVASAPARTFS